MLYQPFSVYIFMTFSAGVVVSVLLHICLLRWQVWRCQCWSGFNDIGRPRSITVLLVARPCGIYLFLLSFKLCPCPFNLLLDSCWHTESLTIKKNWELMLALVNWWWPLLNFNTFKGNHTPLIEKLLGIAKFHIKRYNIMLQLQYEMFIYHCSILGFFFLEWE